MCAKPLLTTVNIIIMTPSNQTASVSPDLLLKAVEQLLRPLVRLMIGAGLTFPVLADALRQLFVDVAVKDLLTDPDARTDSRINLLTGVHRKEIRRLRTSPPEPGSSSGIVTLAAQLVARWVGGKPFVSDDGVPLALPRGDAPHSFDALVASVTSDVRPRAVLDDLLSQGTVFLDNNNYVRLNTFAFIPRQGGEEQVFYFARNLHDHVAAAAANLSAVGQPPFLDRSVHYDRLTPEQARQLETYARDVATRALLDVNRFALDLIGQPSRAMPADRRVNLGIYLLEAPDHTPPDATLPDNGA